jgi:hypothetical protein
VRIAAQSLTLHLTGLSNHTADKTKNVNKDHSCFTLNQRGAEWSGSEAEPVSHFALEVVREPSATRLDEALHLAFCCAHLCGLHGVDDLRDESKGLT